MTNKYMYTGTTDNGFFSANVTDFQKGDDVFVQHAIYGAGPDACQIIENTAGTTISIGEMMYNLEGYHGDLDVFQQ